MKAFGTYIYADLVVEPNSFAFTVSQSGGIFNAGNLEVGKGETLNLLGGSVINTGTLKSEGGNINVAAIPGEKLVRITQEGNLLSLGLPTSTESKLNPVNFTPRSLPKLLTGGNLNNATGVTVENGVIKLTSSGVEIPNDVGIAIVSGKVDVSGDVGGTANVLGEKVGIVDGNINAAGTNGGGTVLIGGDYKGEGTVPNAKRTVISRDSVVKADAFISGNGGKVIAWADETTVFQGTISARGGKNSGDGGFVEVSGKENLAFDGFVDVGADFGKGGELFLDPRIVEIVENGDDDSQLNNKQEILKDNNPNDTFTISANKIVEALSRGNVTIEATESINITSDIELEPNDLNINAYISVKGNLNLQAKNIEISESNIRVQGNIKIQGDEGISITAPNNILQSGGDFSLISNGKITADARISSGGNFSADSGTFSQSEEFNLNGIISSNGDVTFGNYTGSSLKVEAKGNIQGGNITIDEVGTFPQTGDPDINILNAGEALILRAGVTELKHNPQSENLGNTVFTSTTNPSSQGNITVGNIDADVENIDTGSYVILSAKGDIVTGSIKTKGQSISEPVIADSVNLTSSNGKIIVDYISVSNSNQGTDENSFLGDVNINSFGVFQAKGSDDASIQFGSGSSLKVKASIVAPGKISIKHGGENFQYALGLEKDSDGQLIFREDKDDGRQVLIDGGSGGQSTQLKFADGESRAIDTTVRKIPFDIKDIPENTSFTVGGIFIAGGSDSGLYGSFQDTELPNSGGINVSQVPQPPEPPQPPELNQDKNNICSPQSSTVATNSENSTRDISFNNNPCKTTNDKDNILKVIPDNRFNSNSVLPTSLLELGER